MKGNGWVSGGDIQGFPKDSTVIIPAVNIPFEQESPQNYGDKMREKLEARKYYRPQRPMAPTKPESTRVAAVIGAVIIAVGIWIIGAACGSAYEDAHTHHYTSLGAGEMGVLLLDENTGAICNAVPSLADSPFPACPGASKLKLPAQTTYSDRPRIDTQ